MRPTSLAAHIIATFLLIAPACAGDAPATLGVDGSVLADAKIRFQKADDANHVKLVKKIIKEGDKALSAPKYSVVNKPFTPPSGDKHDYMSLSPYWWPDPTKQDGKPYIRKDGQTNPEREKYDQPVVEAFSSDVENLALAYYFSGDEKYASKAAELIRVWFFDDATKMNPNCRYAQFRPGYDEPQASGTLELNRLRRVCDADILLAGSSSWPKEDHDKLALWFKEFLNYMLTSPQGKAEHMAPNNHGTWYVLQAGTYAIYVGDEATAKHLLEEIKPRIAMQIEPDGTQPQELRRTKAYDYTRYNLEAMMGVCMLGDRVGMDLWNYKSPNGRSLRLALDWFAPYASGEKQWEGKQITDPKMAETVRVYRIAARGLKEPKYEAVAQAARKRGKIEAGDRLDLLCPALEK